MEQAAVSQYMVENCKKSTGEILEKIRDSLHLLKFRQCYFKCDTIVEKTGR